MAPRGTVVGVVGVAVTELRRLADAVWHHNLRERIELAQMKRAIGLRLNHNERRALS